MSLEKNIDTIKGVGDKLKALLSKKGISTLEDALYFLPRDYEDRRQIKSISELVVGEKATILAVLKNRKEFGFGRQKKLSATVYDGKQFLSLMWFRYYPSIFLELEVNRQYLIYGKIDIYQNRLQIIHPEFEKVELDSEGKPKVSYHFGRIVPIYSETEGLYQKSIRKIMASAIKESLPFIEETFEEEFLSQLQLPTIQHSFASLHFPKNEVPDFETSPAIRRIAFEEFFILQLGLAIQKKYRQSFHSHSFDIDSNKLDFFLKQFPFKMTRDQKNAIETICEDLKKSHAMARLIQGDVGCGKTAVALSALWMAFQNQKQSVLMAPTEVLAQQLYDQAQKYLTPLGVSCIFLSHQNASDQTLLQSIKQGNASVVIGTHAVFQEKVIFKNLSLVIVDEQHRFGVEQRTQLVKKGFPNHPHLLLMTATPIPRSLALTSYGDLDLTLIQEKPATRKPIITKHLSQKKRAVLYETIQKTVDRKEQVYIIYPLVEQSEKLDLKSATEMFETFTKMFDQNCVGLVHGRMKSAEKEKALLDFKENKIQILVSTTVVEVGIDVPNATLMVIEHPERLGLSQLHQLRGRVGRGEKQSVCLLMIENRMSERLKVFESTEDGFLLSESDLKMRGPGDFLGTRQSGLPGFKVGNLVTHADLIDKAKWQVETILNSDPNLEKKENQTIRKMLETKWQLKLERLRGI